MTHTILRAGASLYALALLLPVQTYATINGTVSGTSNTMYTAGVYHYGPSIIMNGDGTGDAWFCGPGSGGAWDFVYHETTSDNGVTWGSDSAVLKPTSGSPDAFSNCDPGAVKIGSYYYIGYTSTTNSRGANNQVYVARSTSATGPWDKWNGSGWGGTPAAFITYSDSTFGNYEYGSGEPSFVYNPNGSSLRTYSRRTSSDLWRD